ncbi:MAG TPA: MHYT domain-containing protein [Dyella sp.]|uniref:MHYT domain-containing protein n=1 Tax=Dyella sp. TaxID=1869338 RepID=UPI002F93AD1D
MNEHMIHCELDPLLAALSYAVSVLGSFTALQLAIAIPAAPAGAARTKAVIAAGAAMGGGAIWAMHFIAMLACRMPIPVTYDIGLTVLSAIIGIGACTIGLAIVGNGLFTPLKLTGAGLLMGVGVAGMHYTGMSAMQMPATLSYDMNIVAISVAIAVIASIAALWLAFRMRGTLPMLASALVMGVAVSGMHYTGMEAAKIQHAGGQTAATGIASGDFGIAIFLIVALLLGVVLMITLKRQQQRAQIQI